MVSINSSPDPQGNVTQLEIDSAGTTMHIRAVKSGTVHSILTANLSSLFAIEFSRHSLRPPPPPHPQNIPNWAYWGVYRYAAAAPTRVEPVSGGVRLVYEQVGYVHDVTGRSPEAPLPAYVPDLPDEHPAKIQVIATITPTIQPHNAGLINFDIEHTYPSQFLSNNTTTAWESRVIYPRLRFNPAEVAGFEPFPGPVQCSALFKVDQAINAFYFMRGIAVYTDDDNGHFREVRYEPDAGLNALAFHIVNPIHLKDTAGSKAYVRPASFKLTGGDEFGYGGNVMVYRLRAFHVSGVYDFAPVGIYDVLARYREWVKARRPVFYRKHITTRAPGALDKMAPFSMITNYSPDGPIDPSVSDARFPDLRKWLEQHPAKHGDPDMPGNKQPSLLTMLGRLRSKFNAWGLWENLGQDGFRLTSAPAVSSWAPGRLDVFARGADNALWHKWYAGSWSGWENLGGGLHSAPAAVSWASDRIDVFVRGTDDRLHTLVWDGTRWHNWAALGTPSATVKLASAPAVASWRPNRLDVFVRGTDNALWHRAWQDNQWYGWASLGGVLTSSPAAVSWAWDRIDVFVRGTDNAMYVKSWEGTRWTPWASLGAPPALQLASAPAAASWGEHHLEVYVRATDNRLWRRTWSAGFDGEWEGGWSPWEATGQFTFKDDPAAVCWAVNRTDVFVRGMGDTLQHRWSDSYARLEAQIWCQSMAPMYRFYGGPRSASSTISRDDTKFRRAMDELTANGIDAMITTDPLNPIIDRKRFSLHLVKDGAGQWKDSIPHSFPSAYQGKTCAVTDVTIDGVRFNRVFLVRANGTPRPATPQPSCADVQTAFQSQRRDRFGRLFITVPAALGTGLFKSTGVQLCPTKAIEDIYLDGWLRDRLFADNVRLIEFMKHGFHNQVCYDKNHQHREPPISNPNYNAVMGVGSWNTKRYKTIFERVQNLGFAENNSFWLTTEFQPSEQLIPYFDEVYTSHKLFHFVYSNFVSPKMHLFRDWAIHPGYREKIPKFNRVPPVYMLEPQRDDDAIPTGADLKTSFDVWLGKCEEYAALAGLTVARYGIAPKDYPTGTPESGAPSTYTFRRFVQDIFNLRATILDLGQPTVDGRRVCVPAILVEEPTDYNDELVNTSVRASHFQMAFKDYFRQGFMLGETAIFSGQQMLWAWGNGFRVPRPFNDVAPLVLNAGKDDARLGAEWRGAGGGKLSDFISRPVDRLNYYEVDAQGTLLKDALGNYLIRHRNEILTRPKVSHMIWQLGEGDTRSVLYAFANVGNKEAQVTFLYGLGLEGVFENSQRQTVTTYVTGAGTYHVGGTAWLGKQGTVVIPPRSFAGVEITKIGLPPKFRTPAW